MDIHELLADKAIKQEQYDILVEDKINWFTEVDKEQDWSASVEKIKLFNEALKLVINAPNTQKSINLSYIHFPPFTFKDYVIDTSKQLDFKFTQFYSKADFSAVSFYNYIDFTSTSFDSNADFSNTSFDSEADFSFTSFHGVADFRSAAFHGNANFTSATFDYPADLRSAVFHSEADFICASFNIKADFSNASFNGNAYFSAAFFDGRADFSSASFDCSTDFSNAEFNSEADFSSASFDSSADFSNNKFKGEADFSDAAFRSESTFQNATFSEIFTLYNIKITKLNLLNAQFDATNLLGISAYDITSKQGKVLTKTNFDNKETARLIKGHLDSHNNITESNKYFALEQELYLDDLKNSDSTEPNKWQTIIALYFNKYISNFGTDWLRSLIVLILFGYIVMIGYMTFDHVGWLIDEKDKSVNHFSLYQYLPLTLTMIAGWGFLYRYTFAKDIYLILIAILFIVLAFFIADANNIGMRTFTNYIVQITNPIGAFKDVELYKGIEFYATIVRITIAVMIYQLIVAFRNNTRRS